MCGICGYVNVENNSIQVIKSMTRVMHHRGPDDSGFEVITNQKGTQVGLGQARLSIIDLSPAGHQPMHYKNWVIVFNGEIYNFQEIKTKLISTGHQFVSTSDTEVVLHAFEEWGLNCVHRFIGMFAFAIHSLSDNKLYCCRDRAGVKPFHYYHYDDTFIFGSELKVLHEHPSFHKELDMDSVNLYFRYGYVPTPHSIFKHTHKLEPGSWLIYDTVKNTTLTEIYWNIAEVYQKPILKIDYAEAKEELKKLLVSACNYRMISDVPVGVFLSGGYDSNLVASILQSTSNENIKTFTIGFDQGNNEAPFAKQTAAYLGTDHTEHFCTKKEALDIIPTLPFYYDEPFADSSAIPTILVSQLARKNVTVALSADAGDEVFIGYNRYRSLYSHLLKMKRIPNALKGFTSVLLKASGSAIPDGNYFLKHKIESFAGALKQDDAIGLALLLDAVERAPESFLRRLLPGYNKTVTGSMFNKDITHMNHDFSGALAYDYNMYLQNDILTKVDRATMSVSLEGREPLLDHRIIEFAATLPYEYKYDGITTKKILKDIVHDYIPKELMNRPKTGFSIPVRNWLNGELNVFLRNELLSNELGHDIFDRKFLNNLLDSYFLGKFYNSELIWRIVQFQLWYNRWMK